ncbi:MAG: type II 3-dehydroquinate dehydratase [Candidatus Marinimicrobia bacterium]|jgi:3-dehydroquinate dehydratase-2|nr:type II 3-dehydroquinate dehydratase [Candidatus Neomarinimicrobiota bacterium]HIB79148.1 type II 3-dehydroquinate dehydratase [Candidatus Neomarinimicrobiota bacterium]|tara:strand:- start:59 stop:487 length:429 start_codon:yes stop_codon:yes gene_type:complete
MMNIIVLHGPNLNLLGSISAQSKQRITLDKINKALRLHVRNSDINLKISQTHKVFQAINFIQRNRNWAHGFLFAPMAWARYEYSILDALKIAEIPTVQLLFLKGLDDMDEKSSIFSNICHSTIIGDPNQIYIDGIDILKTIS